MRPLYKSNNLLTLVLVIAACAMMFILVYLQRTTTRDDIAKDLVVKFNSGIALSFNEISNVLGSPDERVFSGWDAAYSLGRDKTYFSMDSTWLVIRYELGTGRVVDAKIIVD